MISGRTPDLVSGTTPEDFRDFFAAVFARLDARPHATGVRFKAHDLEIDIANGNPVFIVGETRCVADFRGRWLPEHPVPLRFHGPETHALRFVPTTGNRVKVRVRQGPHMLSRFR